MSEVYRMQISNKIPLSQIGQVDVFAPGLQHTNHPTNHPTLPTRPTNQPIILPIQPITLPTQPITLATQPTILSYQSNQSPYQPNQPSYQSNQSPYQHTTLEQARCKVKRNPKSQWVKYHLHTHTHSGLACLKVCLKVFVKVPSYIAKLLYKTTPYITICSHFTCGAHSWNVKSQNTPSSTARLCNATHQ